jgi:hypothetical protein
MGSKLPVKLSYEILLKTPNYDESLIKEPKGKDQYN